MYLLTLSDRERTTLSYQPLQLTSTVLYYYANCSKKWLNQASFVLLCFVLFAFFLVSVLNLSSVLCFPLPSCMTRMALNSLKVLTCRVSLRICSLTHSPHYYASILFSVSLLIIMMLMNLWINREPVYLVVYGYIVKLSVQCVILSLQQFNVVH